MMVKNTSVLVLCAFLPAACHGSEQPAVAPSKVPNVQAPPTQRVSVSPQPITERESVIPQSTDAPPRQIEAPSIDRVKKELQDAKNDWNSAFYANRDAAMLKEAKRRGFARLVDGLELTVQETIDGGLSLNDLKRTAINLGGMNDLLVITQVVGDLALVVTDRVNFMFKGPREYLYEGTPLHKLGMFWKVTGTTTYKAVLGTKQAFVITTIDPIEPDETKVWEATLAAMKRPDGSASVAQFDGKVLLECIDGSFERLREVEIGSTIGLSRTCRETFSVAPVTTCDSGPDGALFGYALPIGETECVAEIKGAWSTTAASSSAGQTSP